MKEALWLISWFQVIKRCNSLSFFRDIYKKGITNNLEDQLKVLKLYSIFFSIDEGREVGKEVILGEVKYVLKYLIWGGQEHK